MVRTRKISTEDEVTAAPTRRSGRSRAKPVTYNVDGDDDGIPPEVLEASLAEVDPDVEEKPKRGRKKAAPKTPAKKGRTSRRTSKAKIDSIPENEPDVVSSEETISEDKLEEEAEEENEQNEDNQKESPEMGSNGSNGSSQENSEVESKPKEAVTHPEKTHEDKNSDNAKINSKLDTIDEKEHDENELLPDFEEEEGSKAEEESKTDEKTEDQKEQEEPFEMINKDEVPNLEEAGETENNPVSADEEKLPEFEEEEQDPDMLQLDANVDEDMDLNKAEEPKEDKQEKAKTKEDDKKEERKRRWKSDEKENSPKRRHSIKKTDERVREPSPPAGEPKEVVHITNLVRPFTLGQLKDFLQVHGDYSDFWIDKIKSNCFVKYNDIESAINCRKLIHGKKWPSSNPKSLRVMYSTDAQLEKVKSGSVLPTAPLLNRDTIRREKKRSASRSPIRGFRSEKEFDNDHTKEKHKVETSDESDDNGVEAEAILLDDLFKKTKTTPSIYWLALTDEEIKQRDEAREERKRLREERRKASEERRAKEKEDKTKKRSRSKSRNRSRSVSKKRSRSRS